MFSAFGFPALQICKNSNMTKGISIKNVSFSYEKDKFALRNNCLEIKKGSFLGIAGVNGSGKTTFCLLLNGLIPHFIKGYLSGEILIDGTSTKIKNVAFFAQKVGLVFQNPDFSLFNLTVKEEIEFGLKNLKVKNQDERIKWALSAVRMSDFLDRDPQTLSIGEKQKVSLACVLALETKYIVLDEPIAQLDYKSALEIYKILKNLNKNGKTVIVVEHDTDFLWQFANEVIILDKGEIISSGAAKKILSDKNLLNNLGLKPVTI